VPADDSSGDNGTTPGLDLADASPDPEATYLQKEEARIVSAAIRHLRPGMRRAVELRELGDLSTQETARRMGLSVAAIKGRVFHARKELGKALKVPRGFSGGPELRSGFGIMTELTLDWQLSSPVRQRALQLSPPPVSSFGSAS